MPRMARVSGFFVNKIAVDSADRGVIRPANRCAREMPLKIGISNKADRDSSHTVDMDMGTAGAVADKRMDGNTLRRQLPSKIWSVRRFGAPHLQTTAESGAGQ